MEERGLHTFVVAASERPGIVPSGGRLVVRGDVASVRWELLAAAGLAVVAGFVVMGPGREA